MVVVGGGGGALQHFRKIFQPYSGKKMVGGLSRGVHWMLPQKILKTGHVRLAKKYQE